ncbi:NUDIX domain-containing protein [Arthrobacter sp. NPDC058097]|uniref:NUDIX domain-containing protein n=1 Tax=Arthrobacter sp. NPDC058097 TaxID=3346340 RepID=UPI0036DB27DB
MSTIVDAAGFQTSPSAPPCRVVAVVVQWRDKIALLKRSRDLAHDRGRWHCVTGYLEPDASPEEQAFRELLEETGLAMDDLLELREGRDLMLSDGSGMPWLVHTFTAVTSRRRLELDWEHESYRWTPPGKTARFSNRVSWLDSVLEATGHLAL